jgi:ketosteroid isomerase-like protein
MKTLILLALVMTTGILNAQEKTDIASKIIAMEKAALERWNKGDVWGFLEINAPDVVYFDPFTEKRINGLQQLTELYKTIEGQVKVEKYEMIDPKVQSVDNMAVLTFNLVSYSGNQISRWNSTEVYRKEKDGSWKIIQSHWSFTKPELKM